MPGDNPLTNTNTNTSSSFEPPQIQRLGLHLPEFKRADPELWFALADRAFCAANITSETTKFAHAVSHLGTQFGSEVRDIILNPPNSNPYTVLRDELIKRLGDTQASKTKKLIEDEAIGDQRPSQFMRRLRNLGGSSVTEDLIKTLWISRLPALVQAILAAHKNLNLDTLAELADSIFDSTKLQPTQINQINTSSNKQDAENPLILTLAQLNLQISAIQQDLQEIKNKETFEADNKSTWRSRDRRRHPSNRNKSRSSSKSNRNFNDPPPGLCWYHWSYGNNATKCKDPCNFNVNKEN